MPHPLEDLVRPELAELESYVPASFPGVDVRLDANEAPAPAGSALHAIVARAMANVRLERYPDARATLLRERIAAHAQATPEEILVGSGSDEVIALLMTALARPRRAGAPPRVLVPSPTFVMYRVTARAHGYAVGEVPLDDAWDLDVDAFARAIDEAPPNVVFLATPNNPTGNAFSKDRVGRVIELAKGALVVVDEAYGDYASSPSLRGLRARHPHVAILRTLSKIGLAAVRVGWLEADAEIVRAVDKARQPFNVSATSQAAAAAVLGEGWSVALQEVAHVVAEREHIAQEMRALGLEVTPSEANFSWVKTPGDAAALYEGLIKHGVLVRSFHRHGGRLSRQLRVTVGTPEEGDRFLEALRACLA